jgi:hypothetical protein
LLRCDVHGLDNRVRLRRVPGPALVAGKSLISQQLFLADRAQQSMNVCGATAARRLNVSCRRWSPLRGYSTLIRSGPSQASVSVPWVAVFEPGQVDDPHSGQRWRVQFNVLLNARISSCDCP